MWRPQNMGVNSCLANQVYTWYLLHMVDITLSETPSWFSFSRLVSY